MLIPSCPRNGDTLVSGLLTLPRLIPCLFLITLFLMRALGITPKQFVDPVDLEPREWSQCRVTVKHQTMQLKWRQPAHVDGRNKLEQ